MSNYFHEHEAEQFAFIQIPKVLFTSERYQNMSTDAKVLYGILLDRVKLSKKNRWIDEQGRVYIIFPREEAQEILGYKKDKVIRLFRELRKVDLIEEVRRGLNVPNIIYVKKFIEEPESNSNQRKSEKPTSGSRKNRLQEVGKTEANNTDLNNTDLSNTTTTNLETNYYQDTKPRPKKVVVDNPSRQTQKPKCQLPTNDDINMIQSTAKAIGVSLSHKNAQELFALAEGDLEQISNGIQSAVQYAQYNRVKDMWSLIKQSVLEGKIPALVPHALMLKQEMQMKKKQKYQDVYMS